MVVWSAAMVARLSILFYSILFCSILPSRCLVHCAAGINRSGFVAGAALLLHTRLPVLEAVARLRAARGVGPL